jgi:hypothetical protein
LVFNGFEGPDAPPVPGFTSFAAPTSFTDTTTSPNVTWTVPDIGGSGSDGVDIIDESFVAFGIPLGPAHTGDQFLDINGSPGPGRIETGFADTDAGSYNLSFAYTNNPARVSLTPPAVLVELLGNVSGLLFSATVSDTTPSVFGTGVLAWDVFAPAAIPVPAANTTLTLRFTTDPTTDTDFGGVLLDSVSVTAVPEARSWLAICLVCVVVGLGYVGRALLNRPAASSI